jgi:hypothetical protein
MARFEEEDPMVVSGMTDSTSTESDDPEFRMSAPPDELRLRHGQPRIEALPLLPKRPNPSMTESLTGVSWSEDVDQAP